MLDGDRRELLARYLRRPKPDFVEFFAGIGLVRLALEPLFRCAWSNDYDAGKRRMYADAFGDEPDGRDVHALRACDVPDAALWTASFPCNDLSIAGSWRGLNGKESGAFWALIRLLAEKGDAAPRAILLENVTGFLLRNGGADLRSALLALNEVGYAVDAFILNARKWVPQSRARLFIVASKGEPTPSFWRVEPCEVRPDKLIEFVANNPDIAWSLRTLPRPPNTRVRLDDVVERLPADDPHWWDAGRAAYFFGQLSDRHRVEADRMIGAATFGYATAFRRVRKGRSMAELRTDGIAGCLRTPRGGSGRQILFRGGRGGYAVRLLTARECARLQGVPDDYPIDVPLNKALFGFGDAVCVPAVRWIARNYLVDLFGSDAAPAQTDSAECA